MVVLTSAIVSAAASVAVFAIATVVMEQGARIVRVLQGRGA